MFTLRVPSLHHVHLPRILPIWLLPNTRARTQQCGGLKSYELVVDGDVEKVRHIIRGVAWRFWLETAEVWNVIRVVSGRGAEAWGVAQIWCPGGERTGRGPCMGSVQVAQYIAVSPLHTAGYRMQNFLQGKLSFRWSRNCTPCVESECSLPRSNSSQPQSN
jgi:hypothetical protein